MPNLLGKGSALSKPFDVFCVRQGPVVIEIERVDPASVLRITAHLQYLAVYGSPRLVGTLVMRSSIGNTS